MLGGVCFEVHLEVHLKESVLDHKTSFWCISIIPYSRRLNER